MEKKLRDNGYSTVQNRALRALFCPNLPISPNLGYRTGQGAFPRKKCYFGPPAIPAKHLLYPLHYA